jgi:hypothetical protein
VSGQAARLNAVCSLEPPDACTIQFTFYDANGAVINQSAWITIAPEERDKVSL